LKVCPFFGIDPIIQISIIFVAGKAKKYVKFGKKYADNATYVMLENAHI
jgi:hypothetical protein